MITPENNLGYTPPEAGFDALRKSDLGVICFLTTLDESGEKLVLMTVPEEDIALRKSEKLRNDINMVLIKPGMLSFPGGKIEMGEKIIKAILREIWEETGITPDSDRLVELEIDPLEVTQEVESNGSRNGTTDFYVSSFKYQLNQEELEKMREILESQGRRIDITTWQQAAQLAENQIRPSSRALVTAMMSASEHTVVDPDTV